MLLEHSYAVAVEWTGNRGTGTSDYKSYGRELVVRAEGKHELQASADVPFRGNADRWNPEELLLAALSQCHLLSYLHVAASRGVIVTAYTDAAVGTMEMAGDGGGYFTSVILRPIVTIAVSDSDPAAAVDLARSLHAEASTRCFIAASVNFPVLHEPTILVA